MCNDGNDYLATGYMKYNYCEFVTMNSWWLMIIMLCYEYEHCRSRNFMSYYVALSIFICTPLHLYLSIVHVHAHSITAALHESGTLDHPHKKATLPEDYLFQKDLPGCLRKGVKKWKKTWKKPAVQTAFLKSGSTYNNFFSSKYVSRSFVFWVAEHKSAIFFSVLRHSYQDMRHFYQDLSREKWYIFCSKLACFLTILQLFIVY